jgi:hypothetical protein
MSISSSIDTGPGYMERCASKDGRVGQKTTLIDPDLERRCNVGVNREWSAGSSERSR